VGVNQRGDGNLNNPDNDSNQTKSLFDSKTSLFDSNTSLFDSNTMKSTKSLLNKSNNQNEKTTMNIKELIDCEQEEQLDLFDLNFLKEVTGVGFDARPTLSPKKLRQIQRKQKTVLLK